MIVLISAVIGFIALGLGIGLPVFGSHLEDMGEM